MNGLTAPVISPVGLPTDPARERSATFMFTYDRTVAFECVLDASATVACGHGLFGSRTYPGSARRRPAHVRGASRLGHEDELARVVLVDDRRPVRRAAGRPRAAASSGDSDGGSSGDGGS